MRILAIIAIVMVAGCVNTVVAKSGDTVRVDYIGKLEDGTLFDTSVEKVARDEGTYNAERGYEPLEFELGSGAVVAGFDRAVTGMKVSETKTVTLAPNEAYGEANEEMVLTVPLAQLEEAGVPAEEGAVVSTSTGARGVIQSIDETNAKIDFNHQLAGKTLVFTITLVEIA